MRKDGPESRLPTPSGSCSQSHIVGQTPLELTQPPLTVHMLCVQWVQLILLSFYVTQQVVSGYITPLSLLVICSAGRGGHVGSGYQPLSPRPPPPPPRQPLPTLIGDECG